MIWSINSEKSTLDWYNCFDLPTLIPFSFSTLFTLSSHNHLFFLLWSFKAYHWTFVILFLHNWFSGLLLLWLWWWTAWQTRETFFLNFQIDFLRVIHSFVFFWLLELLWFVENFGVPGVNSLLRLWLLFWHRVNEPSKGWEIVLWIYVDCIAFDCTFDWENIFLLHTYWLLFLLLSYCFLLNKTRLYFHGISFLEVSKKIFRYLIFILNVEGRMQFLICPVEVLVEFE